MTIAQNKHQIFSQSDLKTDVVEMPDWGVSIRIRCMSVREQLLFTADMDNNDDDLSFKMIVTCCINEKGEQLFTDPENDIPALKGKSPDNIFKLTKAILKLNKFNAGAMEEDIKNL